jgi:hypothetical protein
LVMKSSITAALLGLVFALCACGSATQQAAAGATIDLGQAQAGQTVHAKVGDMLRVKLDDRFPVPGSSTVWTVRSSDATVLPVQTETVPSPRPGLGTVRYEADFLAAAGGTAVLNARGATTCEAMAKQSCPDQTFTITVIVSG